MSPGFVVNFPTQQSIFLWVIAGKKSIIRTQPTRFKIHLTSEAPRWIPFSYCISVVNFFLFLLRGNKKGHERNNQIFTKNFRIRPFLYIFKAYHFRLCGKRKMSNIRAWIYSPIYSFTSKSSQSSNYFQCRWNHC